ncbi:immunoglobulin-like domain-containing protein [Hyalangium versicolor]|uniref:immunoglobulin-like domain-containing protein n=1 Tax=Hyalangium versicolor TaxID=2861190 RepID=UPI001CCC596C|nr:immunoglobulin-like domain-containing protein [Hyalangium versicolor]
MLLAALVVIACSGGAGAPQAEAPSSTGTSQQEIRSTNKVLILGSSVNGGLNSREAQAVATYASTAQIDVVTPAQWAAMTAQDFMLYRALIIGDAACQSGTEAFQAAIDTRKSWGAIVDGDVAILATDPSANGTDQLVENAIHYVLNSEQKRTGMYIALGCAYQDAPADTSVALLEPFGAFKIQGVPGCADSGHMFEMYNDFMSRDLWDGLLSGAGGCAARSVFTSYPNRSFSYAAVATASIGAHLPGQQTYVDFTYDPGNETPFTGAPYILVRGAMTLGAGCGIAETMVGEECDLGDGLNGQPALAGQKASDTCSWSCKSNWCGDGVVDSDFGEECDDGQQNGRATDATGTMGSCTAFCKFARPPNPPSNRPPFAVCRDMTVVAEAICGGAAHIDNGSYDPDNDLVGCTQDKAGPFDLGSTTVTLTCADQAGLSASCTGVVTVVDHTPPAVAITGSANEALECTRGGSYEDPGASASDVCGGALPQSSIARSGSVDLEVPGTYAISYVATDASGNKSEPVTRTLSVSDTLAPSITLNGLANVGLECSSSYNYEDPGATASDRCAGDLSSAIEKSGSVDAKTPGLYTLRYNVQDPAHHAAVEASRVVSVKDTLAPVVTLNGALSQAVECGGTYTDPGATASDACAGALAAVATSSANPSVPGSYTIAYSATDASGNTGTSASSRTVTVSDTLAPTLTLNGPAVQGLECGAAYADPGASASDQCAGNLTSSIQKSGAVNNKALGTQTLHYSVSDGRGHSDAKDRTVVVSDTLAPSLTLLGALSQQVQCGSAYVDPGASASDVCAGDISGSIVRTGSVNTGAVGSYTLGYAVADPSGNSATAATARSVSVIDTLAPSISLLGSATQTVECSASYSYEDPGATASDVCAGNLTAAIVKTGSVNAATLGSYTLGYSVADASGNTASASRSVTVRDTLAPQLQVTPGASTVQCNGAAYVDPGATASDVCAGNITSRITTTSNLDPTRAGQYTVTYSVKDNAGNTTTAARALTVAGPCTSCIDVQLGGYNLFLLEDYNYGPDVQGKVAAGGNINMQNFSVGESLPASDISNVLVAGKNLTLGNGSVYGNAFYGGTYSANQGVTYRRGAVAKGTPIDFNAKFAELRSLSSQLASQTANGTYKRESWGGIMLSGTNANLNVFNVPASAFSGAALFSITVPSGSMVLINIRGASATFQNFGYSLSGVDAKNILYNFVDTTTINATSFGFRGTLLAPWARMTFNNGNWDGGLYAISLNGTAEGHYFPLNDRSVCP